MTLNGEPDSPAIATPEGVMSYAELDAHITRCMEHFALTGLRPGDRAALLMPPSPRYIVLLLALIRYGAVACPLSTRLPQEGVESALTTLGAHALFETEFASKRGPGSMTPLYYDTIAPSELDDPFEDEPIARPAEDPTRPALAVFTSGTSGAPKAALLSLININSGAAAMNQVISLNPGDRWLLSLPLYHVGGLSILFRCLQVGAAVALPPENASILEAIRSTNTTHVSMVATQLYRALREKDGPETLAILKAIMLGGAPVPATLIRDSLDAGLSLHTSYGMTETAAAITCTRQDADSDELLTSGAPIAPDTVAITDDSRIKVSGPALFQGYLTKGNLHEPELEDDWFVTNDTGHLDPSGRLTVTGRADNMMISGGENIQPEEIEAALCAIPGIIQAVVVPEPDPEFGQRPVAFVETETKLDPAHLEAELRTTLPGFKIPKRIEPWPADVPQASIKANRAWFKNRVS